MQGCPEQLGEQTRCDAVPGDLAEGLQQCGEGVFQRFRGVVLREREAAVELENGVVNRRVVLGEVEVRAGEGGDPGARTVHIEGRGPYRSRQFGGSLESDSADDLAFAAEVAVENGLAVLDAFGEPAGGDRVPALLFGEFTGRRDDEAFAFRLFALFACVYRHEASLALLDNRAAVVLASPHQLATLDFGKVIMLSALAVCTIVVVGVMVGVEFSVAFVINAILNGLPDDSNQQGRSHGGRMLGALMPFWYIGSLVLSTIWAIAAWGRPGTSLIVLGAGLLVVSVVMSILLLVPINNRGKTWTPENRPADWKEQMGRWDRYHYARVAVIIAAFALLVTALV